MPPRSRYSCLISSGAQAAITNLENVHPCENFEGDYLSTRRRNTAPRKSRYPSFAVLCRHLSRTVAEPADTDRLFLARVGASPKRLAYICPILLLTRLLSPLALGDIMSTATFAHGDCFGLQ